MDEKEFYITLSIAGRSLRLKINRTDEFAYREAARKLSNRIDYFYKMFPKADYPSILTVVALEKALDCEQGFGNAKDTLLADKINDWGELIDRVVTEK